MVKQKTYDTEGDLKERAASLLADLPADAKIIRLPADDLPWDVRYCYVGDVRVLQAWDVIADKILTRFDVGYECTLPKQKAHTGK